MEQSTTAQVALGHLIVYVSIKESTMIRAPHGMTLVIGAGVGTTVLFADLFDVLLSLFPVLTIP